jgi:hypothetical protein
MKNWLPNTAPGVGTSRLTDFRAIVERSHLDLTEGKKDPNEILHAHVNAILSLVKPLMPDYADRPVHGQIEIF